MVRQSSSINWELAGAGGGFARRGLALCSRQERLKELFVMETKPNWADALRGNKTGKNKFIELVY